MIQRGYSTLTHTEEPSVNGASIDQNVLVKQRLPSRGIVSSNPKRVERLLQRSTGLLKDIKEHTNSGWGVVIYTCTYDGIPMFIGSVPMGAGGSGFAFFEMYAAGAQVVRDSTICSSLIASRERLN